MAVGKTKIAIIKTFALVLVTFFVLTSAVMPFPPIMAEPAKESGADTPAIESSLPASGENDEQGTLSVSAEYTNMTKEISGIVIQIYSGDTLIETGLTPVNFTLPRDQQFTVVANSADGTFFDGWKDNKREQMARIVRIGQIDSLTALFRDIPGARLISVSSHASVLDTDDTPYPLSIVASTVQYPKADKAIIDSGTAPRTYQLAEGQTYKITASNSGHPSEANFNFSYWIDPVTNEKINSTLIFEASDGLDLHAFYVQADPSKDVVSVESRLDNGTSVDNVYFKILKANEPPSVAPAYEGFTPDTFDLRANRDFVAVASDCGLCFDKRIVFDHWNAIGPAINDTVLADEYQFRTDGVATMVDTLVAVYRIVPDDDFGSVKIDGAGSNVNVEIPSEVNGGVALNFTEVVRAGNLTAAEISVIEDQEIFDAVSDEGIANMTVFETLSNGTIVPTTFSSKGPVVRINDGNLALAGETNITLRFDATLIPEGVNSTNLHVLHFTGTNWEDVTLETNATENTKTALVNSFSPFVIAWDSKFGIGGVGPTVVERHHGGASRSNDVPTVEPLEEQPTSILTLSAGEISAGSISLTPLGDNDNIDITLREVTSDGNITLAEVNSDLVEGFVNASGSLELQGSDFTVLGPMYNLTADPQLAFSGPIDFSVPYNLTSIAGSMDANSTEGSIRLVYYDGSVWHDATIGINDTANKVDGTVQSIGSPILIAAAVVHDGTFGPAYFDSRPEEKMILETMASSNDPAKGDSEPFSGETDCSLDSTGQRNCLVTLSGTIRNAQRTGQNYSIIMQTMDTRGVVHDIEIFSGSLGGGEKEEINLVSSLDSLDSSANYIVQLIVVSDIYGATGLVSEVLKFDLDF